MIIMHIFEHKPEAGKSISTVVIPMAHAMFNSVSHTATKHVHVLPLVTHALFC